MSNNNDFFFQTRISISRLPYWNIGFSFFCWCLTQLSITFRLYRAVDPTAILRKNWTVSYKVLLFTRRLHEMKCKQLYLKALLVLYVSIYRLMCVNWTIVCLAFCWLYCLDIFLVVTLFVCPNINSDDIHVG